MKRTIAVLLAVISTLSLAACGSKTQANSAENGGVDNSLQTVLDRGTLRAGAEGNWNPFIYNDLATGDLVGYEVEIVEEIAKRMGVKVEWSIASQWDGVIAGLQANRYDVVFCGCTLANLESAPDCVGTIPYREDPIVLVVADDNSEIKSWDDLTGKLSANALTGDYGAIAKQYGAELTNASLEQAMELIVQHRVDCSVNSQFAINTYMAEKPDTPVKVAAKYEYPTPEEAYSYGMILKNKVTLTGKINEILQEMLDDGYCRDLAVKYFGQDVADNISLYQK